MQKFASPIQFSPNKPCTKGQRKENMNPYLNSNSAINDWAYMNRLLSGEWVAKRETTKGYCNALVNTNKCKGVGVIYKWWKLNRRTYKLLK
jgi:carbohydrate-binding DOMON domain-containing protein